MTEQANLVRSWRDLFPEGRTIFYEGDDPVGFVKDVRERFGLEITLGDHGEFDCPANLLDEIYGGDLYPLGS